jgi:hypothetical protein
MIRLLSVSGFAKTRWCFEMKEMKYILGKKVSPAEMQMTLKMQRSKLDQAKGKFSERMEQGRQEAKKALERGDESGFRIASRKYSMSKSAAGSINDLREMATEMIDLVDMGEILSGVIGSGEDLVRIQRQLGLDSSKLQSSLARISVIMTHMEDIANVLSTTIENSISNPMEVTADQEVLRKELLTEMSAEKIQGEAAKVKEQVSKELQKA